MSAAFSSLKIPVVNMDDLDQAVIRTGLGQALAPTGSVVGDAAAIVYPTTIVTGADATKGVILPAGVAGQTFIVINVSNAVLKVYPPTGASIDGGTANAAVSQTAKLARIYVFGSPTTVYQL